MANLNQSDVLFLGSGEFNGFTKKVEHEYGFKVLSYDLPPYVSFTSRKAILNTDRGSFFLKEKPEYCSGYEKREMAADFQEYLSTHLVNVPNILRTRKGEHYILWNNRFLFLSEYKPGRIFNGSIDDLKSVLDSLKEFHKVAKAFECRGNNVESYELLIPYELLKELAYSDQEKEDVLYIEKILNRIKEEYSSLNKVDYIMSHGDFSLFNVLFDGQSVVAINDFDNAQRLPRIQDLTEFLISATLINYLAPLSNLKYPVFLEPESVKFRTVLNYYKKHFDLTEPEMKLLPVLTELVWLDILLLAVLKEDYSISDIMSAVKKIERGDLRSSVQLILSERSPKLFIWDFHGTLEIGTLDVLTGIANNLLQENGSNKKYSTKEFAELESFSWRTFFASNLPNLDPKQISAIAEEAYNEKRFGKLIEQYSRPNDGTLDLLKRIKEDGGINIIVSNSRQDKLGFYISHIGIEHFIDEYYGMDDGTIKSGQDVLKKKVDTIKSILHAHQGCDVYITGDAEIDFIAARLVPVTGIFWIMPPERQKEVGAGISSQQLRCIVSLDEITNELFTNT